MRKADSERGAFYNWVYRDIRLKSDEPVEFRDYEVHIIAEPLLIRG